MSEQSAVPPADGPREEEEGEGEIFEPRPIEPEDIELGLRFSHTVGMQTKQRLAELAASFYAMLETFVANGVLPLDEYERRREETVRREVARLRREALVVLNNVPDKYAMEGLPEIDCEARIPLCGARCCTLHFALAAQDLDERVVRWDYAHPYRIAQREDGYCVHNDPDNHACMIYPQRPGFCRGYDCREDKRIWLDFDKRIPTPVADEEGGAEPTASDDVDGEAPTDG